MVLYLTPYQPHSCLDSDQLQVPPLLGKGMVPLELFEIASDRLLVPCLTHWRVIGVGESIILQCGRSLNGE